MNFNIEALKQLIKSDFNGNYKDFAKALNLNSVTVYRVLTSRSNVGEKFISQLMCYCKKKGYPFDRYFF